MPYYTKDSSMVKSTSTSQQPRTFLMAQNILRILAIVLTAASIAVMVESHQTVSIFTIKMEAHFYYSSSLKFLVAANGVVCVMSLLTLMIMNNLMRQQAQQQKDYHYLLLFVHDMVMTLLLMAGCAAATAIGYVGQYGEEHMGWLPLCDHVRKFCRTNLVSLLLSYLALFAYLGLTILTVHRSITFSTKKINQMMDHDDDDPQAL